MSRTPTHAPGDPAPVTGDYQQLNVFGTPTGTVVSVGRGEVLPHAPIGFMWRVRCEAVEEDC
jgi:hypothetical protein